MLREDGVTSGRFRVPRLMRALGLVSKQPGAHAYKQATVERPDIPNRLNREFAVQRPNQVWCSNITYVWALPGRSAGSVHAPVSWLGVLYETGCRVSDQGP